MVVVLAVSGCGPSNPDSTSGLVPSEAIPVTGNIEKLKQKVDDDRYAKKLENQAKKIDNSASEVKAGSEKETGKSFKQVGDSCEDGAIKETDEGYFGHITFTNCVLKTGKLNGTVTVDVNRSSKKYDVKLKNIQLKSSDNVSIISIEAFETRGDWNKTAHNNQTGVSGFIQENGKKLLIVHGINTQTHVRYLSDDQGNQHVDWYSFVISGFFGSDDTGMFKITTPEPFEREHNATNDCPTKGKSLIEGTAGKTATVKAENGKITLDGKELKVCKEGSSQSE